VRKKRERQEAREVPKTERRRSREQKGEVEVRELEPRSGLWEKQIAASLASMVHVSKEKDNKRDEHEEGRPKLYNPDDLKPSVGGSGTVEIGILPVSLFEYEETDEVDDLLHEWTTLYDDGR
jgi:hypothetical protein